MPPTRSHRTADDPAGQATGRTAALRDELSALWSDLLGVETVGPDDDFFALGGHSLLATRLAARIRTALGIPVDLEDIFGNPTVSGLTRFLGGTDTAVDGRATAPPPAPLERLPRDGRDLPLSFPQERIWLLQRLAPHSTAYNFQFALTLRGPLDVAALEGAYTEIVRRHEILRSSFHEADGTPVQRVHPPYPVLLPVRQVPGGTDGERRAACDRLVRETLSQVFDTSMLPLVRWRLLRLAPQEHVLVQVEHHFVHDGWSLGVLLRELMALYRAAVSGQGGRLPELEYQFADVAAHQRRTIRGPGLEAELSYWKRRLDGLPPLLDLPLDRPRPPRQSFAGAVHRELLPPGLYQDLKAVCRESGVTLFMLLSAAFSTLLHRVTGSTDVLTATGVANRRLPQSEPLLGMFVNTLPLRTDLSSDPSFRELLSRVRTATLELYSHQDAPFEKVVAALRPDRDLSYNPMYQVMFSFHDAAVPDLEFMPGEEAAGGPTTEGGASASGALTADLELLHNGTAKADLNVIVVPRPEQRTGLGHAGRGKVGAPDDGVLLWWEYSTDLFDPGTVEELSARYLALLRSVAADPDLRLSRLGLLSPQEAAAARSAATGPARPWPDAGPVPAAIAARAAGRPSAPAIVDPSGEVWDYRRLDAAADRIASRLRGLGLRREDRVVLALPRSAEGIAAQLGVMRAGAAYLPLDTDQPSGRLALMIGDCRPALGLTTAALRPSLPDARWHDVRELLATGETGETGEGGGSAAGIAHPAPQQAAYAICTSGSTGRPKAVLVTHTGLANLVGWHRERFRLGPRDRVAHLAGLGFDASVWEVYPALAAGSCLHLAPEPVRGDPAALRDWLVEQRIDVAFAPTPLAERLLALDWPRTTRMRLLLTGGDRLRRRPPEGLPFALVNAYGPTEHTVVATATEVAPGGAGLPSIGTAVDNTRLLVLDPHGVPVVPGLPGELYLAGPGLARGYLGRPAQTAAAFRPEPDGPPGSRMYRTGDRVRLRRDGELEFLGRVDQQVQLRGLRIEPGEIEHALLRHPAVAAAAVVLDGEGDSARLAGYVVPRGDREQADPDRLRAFLRDRLPLYMVPTAWALLDALPLTASGKLDRAALPAPAIARHGAQPLRPGAEEKVAGVWEQVLGVPVQDRNADFFALGGHSLTAFQVMARLDPTAPMGLLFEHPTVAALAAALAVSADAAPDDGPAGHGRADGPADDGTDATAGLSDTEIEALLAAWDGVPAETTEEPA